MVQRLNKCSCSNSSSIFSIKCCFCEYFVKNLIHVSKFKFVVIVFLNKNIVQPKWINADRNLKNRIVKHENNF